MNKKGFTLVELLAVIAILAILVIIALPNVLKMYNTSKKNIFLVEAKEIYGEVSKKYISENLKGNKLSYVSSEDNTKLEMTGNELKYCIQVDNKGKITAMKIGDNNYYLFYDGSKDISKLDLNDVYDGKYVQNKCDANTTITKDGTDSKPVGKACTYDGNINAGDAIKIGKYTYHYKQEYDKNLNLIDIASDTFNVELTDKKSTNAVTEAPCSSINGKLVTSMALMFYNSKASSIDLSNFDTSNVTNMNWMFASSQATEIKGLNSFNTSNVTNMAGMFADSQVTTLDLNSFDTSNVTNMMGMFDNSQVTTLNLSNFNTSKVTNMDGMFFISKAIEIKGLNKFDTSNVNNMWRMFAGSQATTLDLSSFNTSKVTDMSSMFADSQATTLDLSSFDTSKVTDMMRMFDGSSTTEIKGLDKFDTSKVTNMYGMFADSQVTTIDLSSFDTSNVTAMIQMFYRCKNLKTIYVSDKFNTSNVTDSIQMFNFATNLVGGAGTVYDSSKTDKTYAHIDGGTSNPGYFTLKN